MIRIFGIVIMVTAVLAANGDAEQLERLEYNNPGLTVDLGVGLWAAPLPMDYNGDGYCDLVVSCTDKPYNGLYLFEHPGTDEKMPVFKPSRKISGTKRNLQICYIDGKERLLAENYEVVNFRQTGISERVKIYPTSKIHQTDGRIRANTWKYCDYDGDGVLDLVAGIGDWTDYGWDNAFDKNGRWVNGPLRGFVYLIRNNGTNDEPDYAEPEKILAGSEPIEVYGMPYPSFADFDGDGDLDILCGEFVDTLTYFENIGSKEEPKYARGQKLRHNGELILMDLCMITPVAFDWTKNGYPDIIIGEEDGTVSLIENTGKIVDGVPQFLPPVKFQQEAQYVKYGALVTPFGFDWNNDGKEDLVCGNTAGTIGFIENLGEYDGKIRWAKPVNLKADGEEIRIMAGYNGSIQGPCEWKWGYTTLSVADWDGDGLPDIIVNSILGKIEWYKNIGTLSEPKLTKAEPIELTIKYNQPYPAWNWWKPEGGELVTQWRTTPFVTDYTGNGLMDIVMLDFEGYLALFERKIIGGEKVLLPGKRIFSSKGVSEFDPKGKWLNDKDGLMRLNNGVAGRSGRRKLCLTDWDCDGKVDILVNSENVNFLRNISTGKSNNMFEDQGKVHSHIIAGHTTSPTVVDWNKDQKPDLIIGAEDGHFYYLPNPH